MNSIQEQYKELYESFESVVDHLRTVYEGDDPDNFLGQLESELQKSEKVLNSFNPVKMICSDNECRSENVTVDAAARWDKQSQDWQLEKGSEYPHDGFCYDCDGSTQVHEISDDMTPHIETDEEYALRVASINMEGIEGVSNE